MYVGQWGTACWMSRQTAQADLVVDAERQAKRGVLLIPAAVGVVVVANQVEVVRVLGAAAGERSGAVLGSQVFQLGQGGGREAM